MTIKETGSAVRRLTKTVLLLTAALLVGGILAFAPQGEAKAADNWESESNDTAATANELALNSTIYGVLSDSSDEEDWYKVTVSERGKISFSMQHYDIGETGQWAVSILDENGNTIYSQSHTSGFDTVDLGYRKGTVLYIKVAFWTTYYTDAENQTYALTCSFTKTKAYEMEDNDSQSEANSITVGKKYTALMNESSDADWYKFKMEEAGYMKLTFGPVDISNTSTWYVSLYDKKGNSVAIYSDSTKEQLKEYLKKGTYYLKVTGSYSSAWVPYTFKVTETAKTFSSAPVIKKVNTKYTYSYTKQYWTLTSITLSKKISLADGYEVTVANDKAMKDVITSNDYSSDSKTITVNHKFISYSSGNIYVRVRPYVTDAFGNNIYGKKSSVYTWKIIV